MEINELQSRFGYRTSSNVLNAQAHQQLRDESYELAALLNRLVPDSREKSTAITHLETFLMWANKAVANPIPPSPVGRDS